MPPPHTAADVLAFFKQIDRTVPRGLDIHVVLDNLSAHKAPEVTEWLAKPRQRRWHLHFTPTSSSWLNLLERWFKELTERRLRPGTFTSVPALIDAIDTWVSHRNADPKPFVWHAEADKILEKVKRGRKTLSQVKPATDHWLTDRIFTRWADKERVEATTRADNWAMRAVLARCGYAKEAHYRQAWPVPDGASDAVGYAILRSGWSTGTTTPVNWDDGLAGAPSSQDG